MRHTLACVRRRQVRLDYKPVTITELPAQGPQLLKAAARSMQVTLKIQRYDPDDASAARLETYTVDVPETATLLDALDAVKDERDGTLAYRKSCRMAVCGSCGMRMDGGAVLACKTPMKPLVERGPRAGRSRRWATCR